MKTQLLVIVFILFAGGRLTGQESLYNLNDSPENQLGEQTSADAQAKKKIINALRYRELFINPVLRNSEIIRVRDTIILDIFNDRSYKAVVSKVETDVNGTFTISATLPAYMLATCEISTFERKSFIVIDIPEKNELYKANYNHDAQTYYLLELDKSKQIRLEGSPSIVPPNDNDVSENKVEEPGQNISDKKKQDLENGENASSSENPETITILIAYTSAAANWSSANETNINTTISALMSKSQTALDNSNTSINLQLVHSLQVDYTEQDSAQDLYNLQFTDDGFMDTIHDLRDEYGADLVMLLGEFEFTGGLAFLLTTTSGDPEWAFSLTRIQQASWTYTVIHEIGHNMGCDHHKEQNEFAGPGLFPYSAGWRWTGNDEVTYTTIMTYQEGEYWEDSITSQGIGYFSDPDILFQGLPTGDINNANNARTLREIKGVVAAYRLAPEAITIISPSSNDIWRTNTEYDIVWEDNNSENVKIELYKGDEIVDTISSSIINDGNYGWSVPTGLSEGSDYRIKITSLSDNAEFGFSNHFTILHQPCEDEYEPEDELVNVNVSAFDRILGDSAYEKSIYGTIHEFGDWDYYQLNIQKLGGLSLTLSNVPDGFDLQLVDSNYEFVASSFTPGDEEILEAIRDTGLYYILVGSLVGDSSCTPYTLMVEWVPDPPYIEVEPSSHQVDALSGEVIFSVASNLNWSASADSSWLSVSKTSPTILTVSFIENTSIESRSADIVLSGDRIPSQTVSVLQSGALCFIEISPDSQSVDPVSGTLSFSVNSNFEWSVSDDALWVSTTKGDSTITVSYEANPTILSRTAVISISGGDCSEVVSITQAGDELEFSVKTSEITINALEGSTITFDIESNINWRIENIPAWIEVTPNSGTGSSTVSVKVVESNHTGANRVDTIFITGEDLRLPVLIEQSYITNIIESLEATISIYPNPADQNLFVDLGVSLTDFRIRIFDSHGSYVYTKSFSRKQVLSIDLGEFKSGVYQMEIISDHGRIVKSFVKF